MDEDSPITSASILPGIPSTSTFLGITSTYVDVDGSSLNIVCLRPLDKFPEDGDCKVEELPSTFDEGI